MSSETSRSAAQAAERQLGDLVRRTRRRLLRHYAWEALVGGVLLVLVSFTLLTAVASAIYVSTPSLIAACSVVAVLLAWWVYWSALRPLRRLRPPDRVAVALEEAFPALRSRVISAIQLARGLDELERRPTYSPALVRALIIDAAARSTSLPVSRVVPRGKWRRNGVLALVAGVLLLSLAVAVPDLFVRVERNLSRSMAEAADAPAASVTPLVGDIRLRFEYPEYTGYSPRVLDGTPGEIRAIKGTTVRLRARAMVQAREAFIKQGGTIRPLKVEGDILRGTLQVMEPGTYQFLIAGPDGRRRAASGPIPIEVVADRKPRVRILAPGKEVVVGERSRVEIRYRASDDFGLADASLVFKVEGPGAKERVKKLRKFRDGVRETDSAVGLAIFDLGLHPGERVAYKLRVRDNDVISGPKSGESATHYLKIFSPRERHLELLEEQRRIWEVLVHLLGDEIELGEDAGGSGQSGLAKAEDRAKRTGLRAREIQTRLTALLQKVKQDPLFSSRSRAALEGLRRRLRRRSAREQRWLTASVGSPSRRLSRLKSFMPRHVKGAESDVLLMEKLYKQQKLEALKGLTQELIASQKRLKELIQEYKRTRDPALKAEIEREIARFEQKIQELRQKLASLFDPDDEFINRDAIQPQKFQRTMSRLREALKKGDLDSALRALEQMTQQLQNTLEKVDLSSKAFYESAFYKSQKKMEKLLDEVHELEQAQKKLEEQTKAIEKTARGRAARALDVAQSGAARQIQKKLEEVAKQTKRAGEGVSSRWNRRLATKAQARAKDAARAIEHGDAAEALDMAKRAQGHLKQLGENLRYGRPWGLEVPGPLLRNARRQAGKAGRQVDRAVADLQNLIPQASQALNDEERKQLDGLSQKQKGLRDRAGKLKRRLEGAGDQAPFMSDDAKKSLDEAYSEMSEAEGRLKRGRPREAANREEKASRALGRLKRNLQQASKMGPGQGSKDGEKEGAGRPSGSRERVKIPEEGDHRSPREFREDLLKAMKQGTPPAYKDLVKRYYEDLVR